MRVTDVRPSTAPMKSATTMEATAAMETVTVSTAEAVAEPTIPMVFTPRTAEIPTTVGIIKTVAIGIIEAIAVGIRIVIVMVMMFSLSAWRSNKHHYTY